MRSKLDSADLGGELWAGPYRLDSLIARGGFGFVARATHAPTGRAAAVKVMHADLFADPTAIPRFEREAAIIFELPHPNVVRVHEVGRLADGRPYFAMELLTGQSLDARLADAGRLAIDEVLGILEPLGGALAAAHARGIVHRDIKPSNVFLAEGRAEGRVVLLDFGVAKLLDNAGPSLTASRATLGTLPFMAPEQVLGQPLDTRADVYALGALAFAMLTGKPPFGDQATAVVRQIHLHARPPRPSERAPVDPALDEPLLRALCRDPAGRYATAPEFVRALRTASSAATSPPNPKRHAALIRPSMAVSVALRADPAALADGDEALLTALETSLPLVSAELTAAGLVLSKETATNLLAVSPTPPDPPFARRVLEACVRAYRRVLAGPLSGQPADLGIVAHVGVLHTSEAGTILPGGLLDVTSWSPAPVRGVVATQQALDRQDLPRSPFPNDPRFFFLER
ncbi:serine/threonine-protein kinase [Polyangium jinanense]|uniref:Serine/threonine protein kinase n=1 Tax=Polyangium jinanense TaxID=2829994 RepID=A0A9X3X1D5_9BACT|nr:serine/threonine-protein kinase [Polyangium jinanense]MDC3952814.1 serine/threonine protein kinase [Polyangium jinanense]MDC3980433.1 serine/threonine protein kinase [Polyangium jinanense]